MTDSGPSARELLAHTVDDGRFKHPNNIRTKTVRHAIRGLLFQRSKSCLRALENGYDGVDFILYKVADGYEYDIEAPIPIREQARPWRVAPPDAEDYSNGVSEVRRVDFRPHSGSVLRKHINADIDELGVDP